MCGRYSLEQAAKIDSKMRGLINPDLVKSVKNNYNVAPTQTMPVVVAHEGGKQLELMHWGIPRVLGKDLVKELINTRSDKAFERFWGNTVLHHRCLIPASGFYEWKAKADGKHPFYIHPKDQELFAFAGIWSEWKDKDGKVMKTYSIMTTEPNKEMQAIHTRMPVILHEEDYDAWLTPDDSRDEIEPLLRPYQDGGLEIYEVNKDVNSVRNNSSELLSRIA
jgi:putative SOS response-associated peptidase YedK